MATSPQQQSAPATAAPNKMPVPNVTPERFFNAVNAHQLTAAMKAAIELEVFTAIGEGSTTAAAIAQRCKIAERGARILCDFLTIHGFVTKTGSTYGLAPDSAFFLNRHSPAYVGGSIKFLLTENLMKMHQHLTEAVRRGGTAVEQGTLEADNPDWVKFAEAMAPLAAGQAHPMAAEIRKGGEVEKALDVAAGHGMFGIAVAQQNPKAEIYAADWKNVLAVAQKNAEAAGIAARFHQLPGSAFELDFGSGFDLVLIPNFLHHFDKPTCTSFLRKVQAALKPGGRAVIAEFAPNEDRVTPPMAAAFSMMMLATTASGDAYTYAEYQQMAQEAGFVRSELSPTEAGIQRLITAYK